MVVERWVHETKQWAIQEERLSVSGADGERRRWSLFSFANGRLGHKLLESDTTCDVPSAGDWRGWKVKCNVLSPLTWGDVYEVSPLPAYERYYTDAVSFHVSEADTVHKQHEVVQDRLGDALQVGLSLYVHGATVNDENREVLGEYKLCASSFANYPAYRKVTGKSYCIRRQAAGCWEIRLYTKPNRFGDSPNLLESAPGCWEGEPLLVAREATCLPSRVPAGSWSMRANKRDEDSMGFHRALVPAPSIECTADSKGQSWYEECERHFKETQKRDARAQGLRVPGAVQERVSDLRAGDHIFYPTLTGAVYHHAIVTSNENGCCTGIHFNQGVASLGGVKEVLLNDDVRFKNCDTVYCVNRSDYYCGRGRMVRRDGEGRYPLERKPDEIVRTARDVLIRPDQHGFKATDYTGLLNNCEHFCTYCCTGERYCYQSKESGRELLIASAAPPSAAVVGSAAAYAAIALTAAPVALSFAVPIAAVSSASVVAASMWRRWDRLFKRAGDVSEANGGSSAADPPA